MFKNARVLVGVFLALTLVAAACGEGEGEGTTTTSTTQPAATTTTVGETTTTVAETTTTQPQPEITLVVWADANRAPAVEQVAPAFTDATGIVVQVQIVDFGEMRGQVQTAGPAGEGPDIFIGAHDWTGELAANGVIDPIDLGAKTGDFFQVALDAFSFDGQLYAVPNAIEAVAMYYNADLVPEAPATWDDVTAACDGLTGIENCVGVPGGADAPDAYHHFPFVSSQGGYIFKYDPATGYDVTDVGLDSEAAIEGIQFLEDQVDAGYIDSVNYDGAKNLFLDGKQPFWITGPWEVGNLQSTDLNWSVTKIPTIDGETPAPFVGAQGFFLSAFSENKLVAQTFLVDFIATADAMKALYDADPRLPAHQGTFDQISGDAVAATFALSAADGLPMPNVPQMGSVWGPLGDNLLALRNGEVSATEAMQNAAQAVRDLIAGS